MSVWLYSEINILAIIIFMVIIFSTSFFGYEKTSKFKVFIMSAWFAAGANFCDFIWNLGITGSLKLSAGLLTLTNFFYFVFLGISSLFWYMYSEYLRRRDVLKDQKKVFQLCTPILILIVFLICSAYTGWAFRFDDHMNYMRGPFFYLQHVLSFMYFALAALNMISESVKKQNFAYKEDLLATAAALIPPVVSAILQSFFQKLPILSVGIVISFLLAYINSLNTLVSEDQLTGLDNRRTLFSYLSSKVENLRQNERLYFLFIDIDHFKKINDTYGHNEGDLALKAVSKVLLKFCDRTGGFCARYGGDEFVVVQVLSGKEDIEAFTKDIRENVAIRNKELGLAYNLDVSIGYSVLENGDTNWQDMIAIADNEMYKDKQRKRI